jgi:mono/diheme cytochrome c family protein
MISPFVLLMAALTFRNAPPNAALSANPYAGQADAVAAGRKLFRHQCSQCHGQNGSGSRTAPPLRSQNIRDATPGELFWFLTDGDLKRGMPSWSRVPEQRRWQLVTFLKSLKN